MIVRRIFCLSNRLKRKINRLAELRHRHKLGKRDRFALAGGKAQTGGGLAVDACHTVQIVDRAGLFRNRAAALNANAIERITFWNVLLKNKTEFLLLT